MKRILLPFICTLFINAPISHAINFLKSGTPKKQALKSGRLLKSSTLELDFQLLESIAKQQEDSAIEAEFAKSWVQNSKTAKAISLSLSAGFTIWGLDGLANGAELAHAAVEQTSNVINNLDEAVEVVQHAAESMETAAHVAQETSEGIETAFGAVCTATNHKTWNMMFDAIKTNHGQIEVGVVTAIGAGLFLGTILWTGPTAVIVLGTGKALFVSAKIAAILYASYKSDDRSSFKNFYLQEAHTAHMTFTDNLEYSAVKNQIVYAFEQASAEHEEGQEMIKFLKRDLKETEAKYGVNHELSNAMRETLARFSAETLAGKQVAAQRFANAESMEYHFQLVAMKDKLAELKEELRTESERLYGQKANRSERMARIYYLDGIKEKIAVVEKQIKNFRKPKTTLSKLLSK